MFRRHGNNPLTAMMDAVNSGHVIFELMKHFIANLNCLPMRPAMPISVVWLRKVAIKRDFGGGKWKL